MIELELKPYCQDCMMFKSCDNVLYAGDEKYTTVTCEHMDLCDRIYVSAGSWRLFQSNGFQRQRRCCRKANRFAS